MNSKRIISFFLLSIFLFNTMGYFIAFKAMQYQIKTTIVSEINAGITTNNETILTFNKKELSQINWQTTDKELIYKGNRYDVVKYKEDNQTITYYCLNDVQEDSLFATLDEHIATNVSANKQTKNNSEKSNDNHIIKIFFTTEQSIVLPREDKAPAFASLSFNYTSAFITHSTPPPELA